MFEKAKPIVSVVIPVYNSEKYLNTCINSVLSQTWENIELILVDDGSKDSSGQICDSFAKLDSRVKVIHKQNGGVSAARNSAFKLVSGEFLAFVDSDDYIEKDCFEKLIPNFYDKSVDAVFFGWFQEKNTCLKFPKTNKTYKVTSSEAVKNINNFNGTGYCGYLCNKIYRIKNDLIKFDVNTYICEDYIWNLKMLKQCEKVVLVGEAFYHYIQRDSSASRFSSKQMSEIQSRLEILSITQENWPELKELIEIKTMYSFIKMKKRLYLRNDKENLKILNPYLKQYRHKFYFGPSNIVPLKIKLEALGLEVFTFLRVNSALMRRMDELMFGKPQ